MARSRKVTTPPKKAAESGGGVAMDVDQPGGTRAAMPPEREKEHKLAVFIDQFWQPIAHILDELATFETPEAMLAWFSGERYVQAYTQVYMCCVTPVTVTLADSTEHSEYFHGKHIYQRLAAYVLHKCQRLSVEGFGNSPPDGPVAFATYLRQWKLFRTWAEQVATVFSYVEKHWISVVNANHRRTLPSPATSPTVNGVHEEEASKEEDFGVPPNRAVDSLLVLPVQSMCMKAFHECVLQPRQSSLMRHFSSMLSHDRQPSPTPSKECWASMGEFACSLLTIASHLKTAGKRALLAQSLIGGMVDELSSFLESQLAAANVGRLDVDGMLRAITGVWEPEMQRLEHIFSPSLEDDDAKQDAKNDAKKDAKKDIKDPKEERKEPMPWKADAEAAVRALKRVLRVDFLEKLPLDDFIQGVHRQFLQSGDGEEAGVAECLRAYYRVSRAYNKLYDRHVQAFRAAFEAFLLEASAAMSNVDGAFGAIERSTALARTCLESDGKFVAARDEVLRASFDTHTAPHVIPALVKHLDTSLRHQCQSPPGAGEGEEDWTALLAMFKFVDDKDAFRHAYGQAMAERLTDDLVATRSPDLHREHIAIGQMRAVCGPGYVNGFERMLDDLVAEPAAGEDDGTRWLTGGIWPAPFLQESGPLTQEELVGAVGDAEDPVLASLTRAHNAFHGHHMRRRTVWLLTLSTCEVELDNPRHHHSTRHQGLKVKMSVAQYILLKMAMAGKPAADVDAIASSGPAWRTALDRLIAHQVLASLDGAYVVGDLHGASVDATAAIATSPIAIPQAGGVVSPPSSYPTSSMSSVSELSGLKPTTVGSVQAGDYACWLQSRVCRLLKQQHSGPASKGGELSVQQLQGQLTGVPFTLDQLAAQLLVLSQRDFVAVTPKPSSAGDITGSSLVRYLP